MSQENVEHYIRVIEAWNRDDLEGFLDGVSPEWEFQTARLFPGFKPVYRGREGATEFWNTLREPWETFVVEIERTIDAGERVVGLLRFRGRGKSSGVDTALKYAHVASYAAGENVRLEGYATWDEALEAVALGE